MHDVLPINSLPIQIIFSNFDDNYIFSTFPKYLFFIGTKIPTKHNNLIKPSQVDYFQNNIQLYHCKTNKFMSQSFIT